MTNEMVQTNDTNTSAPLTTRLLVAMEMSLKNWRLVMVPEGGTRNRVKTVEAGRDGFYPYRRLTEAGHEVWVIDSASIEVSRRQKQAKSDGIDGDKLAELMQRKARGDKKALRLVRVPSPWRTRGCCRGSARSSSKTSGACATKLNRSCSRKATGASRKRLRA